ncbi:Phosphoadenosine phosphosulfate reductase [Smittium mucronatum]|uniref:Phosphoadenosine phosphosulfate reductase n=1 Tax=Smittium mucronatum TaxID=133383 RepID=A0A1R0GL48_9FUNG|nr:Phosphoadenosine phosphosulfate reductase [Smittium mucronatum]
MPPEYLVFDGDDNLVITTEELEKLNLELEKMDAVDILKWAVKNFKNLYQETAFGPSGNVILDMLSGIGAKVPLIFIDTLFNFDETIELTKTITEKYGVKMYTYYPAGVSTRSEFIAKYGDKLWETDDAVYDFVVKAEPGQRAYNELRPNCIMTGRRRSQQGDRGKLPVLQITPSNFEAGTRQIVKLNPLVSDEWTFQKVRSYLRAFNVPYNPLLDAGYKSIGDYHSTKPVNDGDDERSGRWSGTNKTECGLHKDYFTMKKQYIDRINNAKN